MAQLRIDTNDTIETIVTVRESDEYSSMAYVRFDRHIFPEDIRGTHEIFMTPIDLELLGRFLVRQADEIRTAQAVRDE